MCHGGAVRPTSGVLNKGTNLHHGALPSLSRVLVGSRMSVWFSVGYSSKEFNYHSDFTVLLCFVYIASYRNKISPGLF
jgi:hypothetical protein